MGDRKYPSIMELAVKAGRWSFIAGSSAAIIGATGCEEEEFLAGDQVVDAQMLDVIEDQGNSGPEDQGGYSNDEWTAGVAPDYAWEPDSKVDVVDSDVVVPSDASVPSDGVTPADATDAEVSDDDTFLSGGVPMEDL